MCNVTSRKYKMPYVAQIRLHWTLVETHSIDVSAVGPARPLLKAAALGSTQPFPPASGCVALGEPFSSRSVSFPVADRQLGGFFKK